MQLHYAKCSHGHMYLTHLAAWNCLILLYFSAQICALHSNLSPVATHVLLGASCVFIFTRNVQQNHQSGQGKSEAVDRKSQ